MTRKLICASLLFGLAFGCSGSKSAPPGGASPPEPQAPVASAGEGVTWDKIKADPGTASGAAGSGEQNNPSLLKGNSPPQIQSANFVAGAGAGGDAIAVVATTIDADGDPVKIDYAWTVNGEPAGNGTRLDKAVRRGDFVTVTMTPSDGKSQGRAVTLRSQVNNAPPQISGVVDVRLAGDVYTARIQASDPDGDQIRYALVSGPTGMSVDPADGAIKWNVPADFKGKAVFMVSARDKSGAQSTHAATITVSETFE
jgi:hypothetical protein